jgi:hypothetical protein
MKRLVTVNIQCPICGYSEQCRGWKQIKETMQNQRDHFREEHMTPLGVIIPNL